jgi:uncharacterized protein (DUF58 family)
MRKSFSARLTSWALKRQGPDTLPVTLRSRRLYILPTKAGCFFGALIAVTFIAGMNYGNGLAMLLTFWLAGFALIAMLQTHRSLAGTRIIQAQVDPAFVGGSVLLHLRIASATAATDLKAHTAVTTATVAGSDNPDEPGISVLTIPHTATKRGWWQAAPICLQSRAPFGLFRTWTWLKLSTETLIYPKAVGHLPFPEQAGDQAGNTSTATGLDELTWLRPFREGDSPRQVAWKAYARGTPLLVREYRGSGASQREFDYSALPILDCEQRLSQLCRWVVDATAEGEGFGLRLPGSYIQGSGAEHGEQCLKALALFDGAAQ